MKPDTMSLKARLRRAEQTIVDQARQIAKLEERLAKVELSNFNERLNRAYQTALQTA